MIVARNEADVREEIASPLLSALGYRRGSPNDIIREHELRLKYPHASLGRKNPSRDPVLIGRPDYVLNVVGAGRWVFEIKSPSVLIDAEAVTQALTYARHPEINAYYVALCNGKIFEIYYGSSRPDDPPVLQIEIDDVTSLSSSVSNVLGPEAIRRDCTPRPVDRGVSLGPGLRSSAQITGGSLRYDSCEIFYPEWLPQQAREPLAELERRLIGLQTSVRHGSITRQGRGRIVAEFEMQPPHDDLEIFALNKGLNPITLIATSNTLSAISESPTEFEFLYKIDLSRGEELFDVMSWRRQMIESNVDMSLRASVFGFLSNLSFIGHHSTVHRIYVGVEAPLYFEVILGGTFHIHLQNEFY